jgi:MFS family permease
LDLETDCDENDEKEESNENDNADADRKMPGGEEEEEEEEEGKHTRSRSRNRTKPKPKPKPWSYFIVALGALSVVSGLLFGYDIGVISGALTPIAAHFKLSILMREVVVGTLLAGALVGSAVAAPMANTFGRRTCILLAGALYWQGTLLEAFAYDLRTLLFGRCLVGVAVGVATMVVPLYVMELAPNEYRGPLVACSELAVSVGILLAFVTNLAFQDNTHGGDGDGDGDGDGWRWMLGLGAVPALC